MCGVLPTPDNEMMAEQEIAGPEGSSRPDLERLIGIVSDGASAIISGRIRRYAELMDHADDFTLMAPNGGDIRRGFDRSDESIAAMERYFRDGEAQLEIVETYCSGDLAVLVVVERQHGRVGGFPDQDLSLRVTVVFRREGSRWRLVHRHADPLVRPIGAELLGALLRGDATSPPS